MAKLSVEEIIRQAIEEGKFDELPGKGKPLNLDENPHEDPAWRSAYRILRNAGYSLPWIETRREIESDLEKNRASLARSFRWRETALQQGSRPEWAEAEWEQAQRAFRERVAELNQRIRSNNLAVPSPSFQRCLIDAEAEIQAVIQRNSKR